MAKHRRPSPFLLALVLPLALLAACAPQPNTVVSPYAVGSGGYVSYGTILSMTPVQVSGTRSGIGAGAGVIGGSMIGSTIGGDWRARAVGAVAGAVIGGLAGAAVEEGVTSGQAVQFIIRQDGGPDMQVIQTNELNFVPGERVVLSHGDRIRLSRPAPGAAAAPIPLGRGGAIK